MVWSIQSDGLVKALRNTSRKWRRGASAVSASQENDLLLAEEQNVEGLRPAEALNEREDVKPSVRDNAIIGEAGYLKILEYIGRAE
jgi:hypothetical protein